MTAVPKSFQSPHFCIRAGADILLFLFLSFHAPAQLARVANLKGALSGRETADTAAVNQLMALSEYYMFRDPKRSLELARQSESLSRRLHYEKGLAQAWNAIGHSYSGFLFNKDSALSYYERSLHLWTRLQSCENMAILLSNIGYLFLESNPRKALEYEERSVTIAEGCGNTGAAARAHRVLGQLYMRQADPEHSRDHLLRSLRLYETIRDSNGLALTISRLADLYQEQARREKALEYYQQSLRISQALGEDIRIAAALANIGNLSLEMSKIPQAIDYDNRALKIFEERGCRLESGKVMGNLSAIYADMGKGDQAVDYAERYLAIVEQLRDSADLCLALCQTAYAYSHSGMHERALKLYKRSIPLAEQARNKQMLSTILYHAGFASFWTGDPRAAVEYFERGIALSREIHDGFGILCCGEALGQSFVQRGSYAKALAYYAEAFSAAQKEGNPEWIRIATTGMGDYYLETHSHSEALPYYRDALRGAEGTPGELETIGKLVAVCTALGKWDEAGEYFQRGMRLVPSAGDDFEARKRIAGFFRSAAELQSALLQFDKALEYCRRSVELYERVGYPCILWNGYVTMGMVYRAMDQPAKAVACFETSREMGENCANTAHLLRSLEYLGILYAETGSADKARAAQERVVHLLAELDEPMQEGVLGNLSLVLMQSGDAREAIALAERVLESAVASGNRAHISIAHEELGALYAKTGDSAKAFLHLSAYTKLNDTLLNERSMRTLAELNARYDAERRENTIAVLSRDRTVQELELKRRVLDAIRQRQHISLLSRDGEIRRLELVQKSTALELQKKEALERSRTVALLTKENALKSSILTQERYVRNSIIAGFLLFVTAGVVGFKQNREKRRVASYRAEAAEYKARAAEAQALALAAESERKERDSQQLFSRELIDSQERERKRIATELHDSLGQELLIIQNQAQVTIQDPRLDPALRNRFSQIIQSAETALAEVRQISRDLRPYQIEQLGITETIRSTVHKIGLISRTIFHAEIDNIDELYTTEEEVCIFRILQEGLNNIVKHSDAAQASVRLALEEGRISITIADDGKGIESGSLRAAGLPVWGFGLRSMHERVGILGGTMTLRSTPGEGTQIVISVPVRAALRETQIMRDSG